MKRSQLLRNLSVSTEKLSDKSYGPERPVLILDKHEQIFTFWVLHYLVLLDSLSIQNLHLLIYRVGDERVTSWTIRAVVIFTAR